jgi:hypothetical protein
MPIPPELQSASARVNENYQLLGQPNVQATLDTLQAGGADIINAASKRGVSGLPDSVNSKISAIDQLRTNGALDSMMSGDLSGVLSKVAPSLNSFPGLQSVFDQSRSNLLGGAGALNSVMGSETSRTLSNTAASLVGQNLKPQPQETSGPLETAGLNDKQNDINIAASHIPPPSNSGGGGGGKPVPERGSMMIGGDQAPLEVRNSESSIRRLTDMLIAFSFG